MAEDQSPAEFLAASEEAVKAKPPVFNIDESPVNANWIRILGARRRAAAGTPEPGDDELLALDKQAP